MWDYAISMSVRIDIIIYQLYQLVGGFPSKFVSSHISQNIFFHMIGNKSFHFIFERGGGGFQNWSIPFILPALAACFYHWIQTKLSCLVYQTDGQSNSREQVNGTLSISLPSYILQHDSSNLLDFPLPKIELFFGIPSI